MNLCDNFTYIHTYIQDSYTLSEMVCHPIEETKRRALCIFAQCVAFFVYINNAGKDRTVLADGRNRGLKGGLRDECYHM